MKKLLFQNLEIQTFLNLLIERVERIESMETFQFERQRTWQAFKTKQVVHGSPNDPIVRHNLRLMNCAAGKLGATDCGLSG